MQYNWITWADIEVASKDFSSTDVIQKSVSIIQEACQVVYDELSGTYNLSSMIASGIPEQLKRLAIYKGREFASIIYWGNASADGNTAAQYWFNQYNSLLESIRLGKVQVEGYERLHSFTKPVFY